MQYTLENKDLTVTFDTFGGGLTSIQNKNGLEYLWQGDATYWSGQAPVLFPICGSLRNDTAQTSDGQTVMMPRHGIIRKKEFICEKQTGSEIVFSIESTNELLEQYPYDFKFFISYQLMDKQILVQYTVLNRSEKTMPFFVGGHPGFNCPLEEHLSFADYRITFEKEESGDLPDNQLDTGLVDRLQTRTVAMDGQVLPLAHELFKRDSLIFRNSQSKKATLSSPKGNHGVEIRYEDFPNLLVWSTANNGPFVALEPMIGFSTYTDEDDIFEHKEHVQLLESGQQATYRYQLSFF